MFMVIGSAKLLLWAAVHVDSDDTKRYLNCILIKREGLDHEYIIGVSPRVPYDILCMNIT